MAIILKISVRFTLKELKCEFSSSFDSISGYEEGVLHIAVMFGKKKKKGMGVKENIGTRIFSQTRRKKDHSTI